MTMDVATRTQAPAPGAEVAVRLSIPALTTFGRTVTPMVSVALTAGSIHGIVLRSPEEGVLLARRVSGFDGGGEHRIEVGGVAIGGSALDARRAGVLVWGDEPGPLERYVPAAPVRVLVVAADGLRGGAGGAALGRDIRELAADGAAVLFLSVDVGAVFALADSITEL